MKTLRAALLGLLCLAARGVAEEEPDPLLDPPPRSFAVDCRMIVVDAAAGPELVAALNDPALAEAALRRLEESIARGEATLAAELAGAVRDSFAEPVDPLATVSDSWKRSKMTLELAEEVRYATKYKLWEVNKPPARGRPLAKAETASGLAPVDFDTRNTGPSLEMELQSTSDPATVLASYIATHTRLARWVKLNVGEFPRGEPQFMEQPFFSTLESKGFMTLESGRPKLIGVHRLPGPEAKFELFLLTARWRRPDVPKEPAASLASGGAGAIIGAASRAFIPVRLEMQAVAVPMAEGRRLVMQMRRPGELAATRARLHTMLATGDAELLASPVLETFSGTKAETSAVEEIRYGTEFDGGGPPTSVSPPTPPTGRERPWMPKDPNLPYDFDTRHVGWMLKGEPLVDPKSGAIQVALTAGLVRLEALEYAIGARSRDAMATTYQQPRFTSRVLETTLVLPNGGDAFLTTFTETAPQQRLILLFLHAVAQPPPPSPP